MGIARSAWNEPRHAVGLRCAGSGGRQPEDVTGSAVHVFRPLCLVCKEGQAVDERDGIRRVREPHPDEPGRDDVVVDHARRVPCFLRSTPHPFVRPLVGSGDDHDGFFVRARPSRSHAGLYAVIVEGIAQACEDPLVVIQLGKPACSDVTAVTEVFHFGRSRSHEDDRLVRFHEVIQPEALVCGVDGCIRDPATLLETRVTGELVGEVGGARVVPVTAGDDVCVIHGEHIEHLEFSLLDGEAFLLQCRDEGLDLLRSVSFLRQCHEEDLFLPGNHRGCLVGGLVARLREAYRVHPRHEVRDDERGDPCIRSVEENRRSLRG